MSDEEVIKRRLLIDGDGTGDDRRLNILQKLLIKWCNSNESSEETQSTLENMLAQLEHCKYTVMKSRRVASTNAIELENYQNQIVKIKQDIEEEREVINKTKIALADAKIVRRNKVECDVLAKVISEQPDRKETGKKLEQLKKELESLEDCRDQIEKKMAWRRQQFHALVVMIQQLEEILEDDLNNSVITIDDKDEIMEIVISS